jgi:hypothetical protein
VNKPAHPSRLVTVTQPPAPPAPAVREEWKYEVVELMDLVNAVAVGLAPVTLLLPNDAELKKLAKEGKEKASLPGVHFYAESVPVVR